MSGDVNGKNKIGAIEWCDLTVANAEEVRDFYSDVVGWEPSPLSMSDSEGSYDDFCMNLPNSKDTVTGVCHARGSNSKLPAQWLMYVRVDDIKLSAKKCEDLGGKILDGPRQMGSEQFVVIQDPAGAVLALISA